MPSSSAHIIDFHTHYVGPLWAPRQWGPGADAKQRRLAERITSLGDVLASLARGGFSARVLSAPPSIVGGFEPLQAETISAINDHLAATIIAHERVLIGLATIDLWNVDAVKEIKRVHGLGFKGIVVDGAHIPTGAYIDDPAVRPALRAVRDLDLTLFLHPVNLPGAIEKFQNSSRVGTLLGRGAVDAASLLAFLDSEAFEELKTLRIVVPGIASPAFLFAPFAEGLLERVASANLYIDTMGFHPASIRFLAEVLGADRLVFGSDAPIVSADPVGEDLLNALRAAGLTDTQVARVASGNAKSLLGLSW